MKKPVKTLGPFTTFGEMQKKSGLTDASLNQAIKDLESLGLVHVVRNEERGTVDVARVLRG